MFGSALLRDNPDKNACHCRGAASTPWCLHYSKKTPVVDGNRLHRIMPKHRNWHLKDLLSVPVNTHSSCGRRKKKSSCSFSPGKRRMCILSKIINRSFRMSSCSSTIMGSSHYHIKGKCLSNLNANYFTSYTLSFMRQFIVFFFFYAASEMMEKNRKNKKASLKWVHINKHQFEMLRAIFIIRPSTLFLISKLAWRRTLSETFRSGGRVCCNGRPRRPSADLRNSIFHGWKSRTFNISSLRRQWGTGQLYVDFA